MLQLLRSANLHKRVLNMACQTNRDFNAVASGRGNVRVCVGVSEGRRGE